MGQNQNQWLTLSVGSLRVGGFLKNKVFPKKNFAVATAVPEAKHK
jgi:hypothetical protein